VGRRGTPCAYGFVRPEADLLQERIEGQPPIHERKSETLYLLSGRVGVETGDSSDSLVAGELLPGESVDVPRGRIHRVTALEDSVIIEVSTPELDDVVRVEDDYDRAGR